MRKFACTCCGYKTFDEEPSGSYVICPVCFWEDDPIPLDDPDFAGGANKVSLRQAQRNFEEFGACDRRMISKVRPPKEEEQRDADWKRLA
jgi:hypothetical protein